MHGDIIAFVGTLAPVIAILFGVWLIEEIRKVSSGKECELPVCFMISTVS